MKLLKVGAIFNLQEPGEHPNCGDGIDFNIGFSYDPHEFQSQGIYFFNFHWQDLKTTSCSKILQIVQQMDFFVKQGKRCFVHCHAGTGRTAIICGSYLIYCNIAKSGRETVKLV